MHAYQMHPNTVRAPCHVLIKGVYQLGSINGEFITSSHVMSSPGLGDVSLAFDGEFRLTRLGAARVESVESWHFGRRGFHLLGARGSLDRRFEATLVVGSRVTEKTCFYIEFLVCFFLGGRVGAVGTKQFGTKVDGRESIFAMCWNTMYTSFFFLSNPGFFRDEHLAPSGGTRRYWTPTSGGPSGMQTSKSVRSLCHGGAVLLQNVMILMGCSPCRWIARGRERERENTKANQKDEFLMTQ